LSCSSSCLEVGSFGLFGPDYAELNPKLIVAAVKAMWLRRAGRAMFYERKQMPSISHSPSTGKPKVRIVNAVDPAIFGRTVDPDKDLIILIDANYRIEFVSRVIRENALNGFPAIRNRKWEVPLKPQEFVGLACHQFFHARREPCPNCTVEYTCETGEATSHIQSYYGLGPVRVFTFPDKDPATGEVRGFVEIGRPEPNAKQEMEEDLDALLG